MRINIGKRTVGKGAPVFIVAELSGNHGGDFGKAKALVRAAARVGADAVKLQTYTPNTMTIDSNRKWFRVGGGGNPTRWNGQTLYKLYTQAQTPWCWHRPLQRLARSLGMEFFSTPFDATAVDFLETLRVPCYKIAAYEAADHELLSRVAKTGKPVIVSIGFLSLPELTESVALLRGAGCRDLILLHSTATYTRKGATGNLGVIRDVAKRFRVLAGFSDNTGGINTPIAAAALGAALIEKHLVLKHDPAVLDDQFSLDPGEFASMVKRIRMGAAPKPRISSPRYGPQTPEERHNLRYRRSLFVVKDVKKGERFTRTNVRSIRPGFGLTPARLPLVLQARAARNLQRGTPLQESFLARVSFRKARRADSALLLRWRNDPKTRRNSVHTERIGTKEHEVWFEKSLRNPKRSICIAARGGAPVGTLRVDRGGGGAELSWTVAPNRRGRGFGSDILAAALRLPLLRGNMLRARIKADNKASKSIVKRLGFQKRRGGALEEWVLKNPSR